MEIFKELDTAQFSNGWDRTGGANTVMSSSLLASHFKRKQARRIARFKLRLKNHLFNIASQSQSQSHFTAFSFRDQITITPCNMIDLAALSCCLAG